MNTSDTELSSRTEVDASALRGAAPSPGRPAWDAPHLTDRELEVLQCLPTRLSVEELAAALSISPNTVKTHLRSIYHKLGARSRNEAIRIGCEQRLVADHSRSLVPH